MNKLEKKFIKFIGKKICEVLESYNYRYSDDLTNYGREAFKNQRFEEIKYFIEWAEDRGVNASVIQYLNSMNDALWYDAKFIF